MSYGKNTFAYFRIFVEFDTTNNNNQNQNNYINREFRYQRIHDDYTQHVEDFKQSVLKFTMDNNINNEDANILYEKLVNIYNEKKYYNNKWCHQIQMDDIVVEEKYHVTCFNNGPSVSHAIPTLLLSASDDTLNKPSKRIIDIVTFATTAAYDAKLQPRRAKMYDPNIDRVYQTWPGEHYALLKALSSRNNINIVVEIGTNTGLGALALLEGLKTKTTKHLKETNAAIHTFDIIPWNDEKLKSTTWLNENDFINTNNGGLIKQHLANIANPTVAGKYKDILKSADLIFLDAAKNGKDEDEFFNNLSDLNLCENRKDNDDKLGPIILVDDIRLPNMLATWRSIPLAKMDITSIGHWSGTGIIDWCHL